MQSELNREVFVGKQMPNLFAFPTSSSLFNSDCVSTAGAGTGWYIGMETWSSLLPSGRPSFHTDTDTDANHCGLQDRT